MNLLKGLKRLLELRKRNMKFYVGGHHDTYNWEICGPCHFGKDGRCPGCTGWLIDLSYSKGHCGHPKWFTY